MSDYLKVLAAIKEMPRSFQSNYARNNSALVAEAASRGHISCINTSGRNTGAWQVTAAGVKFLKVNGGCV